MSALTRRSFELAVLCILLAQSSCASDKSVALLKLEVTIPPELDEIAKLQLSVRNQPSVATRIYERGNDDPPFRVGYYVDTSGSVTVLACALTSKGAILGHGESKTEATRGKVTPTTKLEIVAGIASYCHGTAADPITGAAGMDTIMSEGGMGTNHEGGPDDMPDTGMKGPPDGGSMRPDTPQQPIPDAGQDTGVVTPEARPLKVTSVEPADKTNNVEPKVSIRIHFSAQLDPSSVTVSSVQLSLQGRLVGATPSATGETIALTLDRPLALLGAYSVVVDGVKDKQGHGLEARFESGFTVRDGTWGPITLMKTKIRDDWNNGYSDLPLAMNSRGDAIITVENSNKMVAYRFDSATNQWGDAEMLVTNVGNTSVLVPPLAAIDDQGGACIVWSSITGSPFYGTAVSAGLGQPWKSSQPLAVREGYSLSSLGVVTAGSHCLLFGRLDPIQTNADAGQDRTIYMGAFELSTDGTPVEERVRGTDAEPAALSGLHFSTSDNFVMTWVEDQGTQTGEIRFADYRQGFSPTDVTSGNVSSPSLALDENDNAMLIWLKDTDIYAARRPRAAFQFTVLGQISNGLSANTREPQIAGRANSFIAAWFDESFESNSISSMITSFWKPDTGWSKAETIYTSPMSLSYRALAIDPIGNVIVGWTENGTAKSIRSAGGKWQEAVTMSEPGVYVPEVSLALDDQGRAFITWAQGEDGAIVRRFE